MSSASSSAYPATSYQPLKTAYIAGRLLSLPPLLALWSLQYTLLGKPRASWTTKEAVMIRMIRWLMPLNAEAGCALLRTDKTKEVPQAKLKETSFTWIGPVENGLITGIAEDEKVKGVRIPGFVWPKEKPIGHDDGLVGLWMHGGGYMMGNGQESFGEANVARTVFKSTKIKSILSVDYRLSSESSHPAQLLDALAAYNHIIKSGVDPSRIVIFGACAGGHLTLLLSRYLYESKVLPMPCGIMVFSPMVDFVLDMDYKSAYSRPNSLIDSLAFNRAPPGSYISYPPTFISVGDAEAYRDECMQLAEVMKKDGANVRLDIQKDAVHDYLGMAGLVPNEKARERVAKNVAVWVEENLAK